MALYLLTYCENLAACYDARCLVKNFDWQDHKS